MRACGAVSPLFSLEMEELQRAGLLWHPRELGKLSQFLVLSVILEITLPCEPCFCLVSSQKLTLTQSTG